MTVHLFSSGKGMITGEHSRTVSTVPETKGKLIIGEREVDIDGITPITQPFPMGIAGARFVGEDGRAYVIGAVILRSGSAVSLNAESDAVIEMLHAQDRLCERYEELRRAYLELKAKVEYDSMGFIVGEEGK